MIPVIQIIDFTWEKDERGGKAAQKRATIRDAYPIKEPLEVLTNGCQCILDYPLEEQSPYIRNSDDLRFGNFVITPTSQSVKVSNLSVFQGDGSHQELIELTSTSWIQLKYNYRHRFTHTASHWWYSNVTLNIGYFKEAKRNSFLKTRPLRTFDHRVDLYRLGQVTT